VMDAFSPGHINNSTQNTLISVAAFCFPKPIGGHYLGW